jgi:propionyl-CoA:succinyl-CoA transferase
VIDNCADPTYREQLRDYLKFVKPGHEPLAFPACFAMHEKFVREGDMRGVRWEGAPG